MPSCVHCLGLDLISFVVSSSYAIEEQLERLAMVYTAIRHEMVLVQRIKDETKALASTLIRQL